MTIIREKLLVPIALLLTLVVYWPGLSGPFLFDDVLNLEVVQRWLDDETSWLGAVIGSRDLLVARPVSMASFTLTAWLGNGGSFSYKLGNLVLHLASATLAWLLLRRLLSRDIRLSAYSAQFAGIVVLFWLLHPLHVSTVLYAVQRMAQLSTFFVLASLVAYFLSREYLVAGKARKAAVGLFVCFPFLVLAGLFSKQNAIIAPGLCLILELAYFSRRKQGRSFVIAFFTLFLAVPLCAALGLLTLDPDRLLAGYADWDFTPAQRLMSEARALMDYIGMLLLPRGPRMGLYTDDFATSVGLLSPPSTLLAILSLATISLAAVALRQRAPSIFAGWFFFLVAHGVESSIIPVELYYEHRNYLPSIGLLLAAVATCEWLSSRVQLRKLSLRQVAVFASAAFAIALVFSTFGRVQIWRSMETITEQAMIGRPDSLRAAQAKAMMLAGQQRLDEGIAALRPFTSSPLPRNRLIAGIDTTTIQCYRDGVVDPAAMDMILKDAQPKITVGEVLAMRQLQTISSKFGCGELSNDILADKMISLVEAAIAQPESSPPKAQMRALAAVGYARGEQLDKARHHADIAWQGTGDLIVGDLLARFYLLSDMPDEAEAVIHQLQARIRASDAMGQRQLASLRLMHKAVAQQGME